VAGKTLHATDLATGKETATADMAGREMPNSIAISPDGATMAMQSVHMIEIWDVGTLKSRKAVVISPIGGNWPAFTADSKTVAFAVYEKVCFFNSQTGEAIGAITAAHPKYVPSSMSISGDGKTISVAQDGGADVGIQIYDASQLEPPPEFKSAVDAQTLFPAHIRKTKPRRDSLADKIAKAEAKRAAEAAAKAAADGANTPAATGDLPGTTQATPAPTSGATSTDAPPVRTTPPIVVKPHASGPTKSGATAAAAFVGPWTANESPFRLVVQCDPRLTIASETRPAPMRTDPAMNPDEPAVIFSMLDEAR
jgi:hypothetical protein